MRSGDELGHDRENEDDVTGNLSERERERERVSRPLIESKNQFQSNGEGSFNTVIV